MKPRVISSISFNQHEIIKDILSLHSPKGIDLDPTYSKGVFYNKSGIEKPRLKYDLYPQSSEVSAADACDLPLEAGSVNTVMFDPPFIVGHTKDKPSGIIGERFHGFRYISDLWAWYSKCITEFNRILTTGGVLIFKCQDTVSSGKQYLSHVHIINEAELNGFYTKDLFILLSKSRIIGHNHANQKHARKFHSYFIVFEKKKGSMYA